MRLKPRTFAFLAVLAAVTFPLLYPLNISDRVSPEAVKFKALIDSIPAGSVVMVSFDHEASTVAEVRPLATVLARHLFSRDIKIVGLSLFAEGTAIGNQVLTLVAEEFGKEYGRDWVFLGFRPQFQAAILGMGENIPSVFPRDYYGNVADTLPLLKAVSNYSQIAMVVSVADGDLGYAWVDYAYTRYHARVAAMLTAVMVASYMPLYASGQLSGLVNGLKGAADYERLLEKPGAAIRAMDAQSMAHAVILLLILGGNAAFWLGKKK
ncbi:MAG: hypothetical protein L0Z48_06630 [candidate division Zixibacteria bacterium]|nr:hypothetical protein [candidate division Zixibacteria bacterium]